MTIHSSLRSISLSATALSPVQDELLPDGVYLSLPERIYFKQRRLGSTDLSKLFKEPVNWHAGSEYNPHRKPRKWIAGNDRDYGHGFHALLLEGDDAYQAKTRVCPFENFTTKDAKAWRDGCHADELTILTEEMDRNIRYMVALVANHPELAVPMGDGLSEVTVLFTDEAGHRLRARFDKLLPGYILDPKSFGAFNVGGDDHERVLRIVAKLSYDVQRYLYDDARARMVDFIREGKVHGGTPEQRAWLARIPDADAARLAERQSYYPNGHPDQQSAWSWSWLFMQKPDDAKGHGAVLLPVERPRFDLTWRTGKEKVERALANFDHYVRRFGLGDIPNEDGEVAVPWAAIYPMWRPQDEEFPLWMSDISSREHSNPNADEE